MRVFRWLPWMLAACGAETAAPPLADDADFEKMAKPQPGEWLYHFPEKRQTFDDYLRGASGIDLKERNVVYLQPLGGALQRWTGVLEKMREYAAIFFGVRVKVPDPLPLFEAAYLPDTRQYDADALIGYLVRRRPKDALAYLGFADADLKANGLNFVFGVGSLTNRCGAYSLVRMETQDEALFLRRAIGLMTHEAGHVLGVTHCVVYRCLMNGSNSLRESDAQPIFLCPEDLRKLERALGFDVRARYEKMLGFLRGAGLAKDAAWLQRHLRRER